MVYLARDTRTGTSVAVKVIDLGDDPTREDLGAVILERFELETRSLGRIRGVGGIQRVLHVGLSDRGIPWIVSEYLPGGSLRDRMTAHRVGDESSDGDDSSAVAESERSSGLGPADPSRSGPSPFALPRSVIRVLFVTLAEAHRVDVVHGDISPNNILFNNAGNPVITDFGMARLLDAGAQGPAGGLTPGFAAPERLRGSHPTAESDVYAMAKTLMPFAEPEVCRVLVHAMVANPTKRPSARKIARRLR